MSRGSLVVVVLVIAVAAASGVAAGSFAAGSFAAASTPSSVVTGVATEPAETAGPDGIPAMTDGFPDASEPYMPDVTVESLEQAWLEREPDWSCETNAGTSGDSTTCRPPDPAKQGNMDVAIGNDDREPERVMFVQGYCSSERFTGLPTSQCRSFFVDVSDFVFANYPNVRKQAKRWARNNATEANANTTVIGGIRVRTDPERQAIIFQSEFAPTYG